MSDNKNVLSDDVLAYCGYKAEGNHLRKSIYDPDPNNGQIKLRSDLRLKYGDEGMLYDPMDIGTDLCK